MNKRKSTLLALSTSALALLGSNALASDGTIERWEGFYLGVHAGVVDTDMGMADTFGALAAGRSGRFSVADFTGTLGFQAGYNWQFDHFVAGLEGDLWWTNAGRAGFFDNGGEFVSSDTGFGGSVRGRIGLAYDNALVYVTAGVGYSDADILVADILTSFVTDPAQTVQANGFATFAAGLGAEMMVTDNVSTRLEFIEHFLSEERASCTSIACLGEEGLFGGTASLVRLGVNYHFGGQNGDMSEPVTSTSDIWSGFYAGVHAGTADTQTGIQDMSETVLEAEGVAVLTNDLGAAGGVHAGFLHQYGSAVFGIEADYSWINAGSSRELASVPSASDHANTSSQIDGFGSLRARLGVTSGNALVYATGGIGYIDYAGFAQDILGGVPVTGRDVSFNDSFGLVAGVGSEMKVTGNLSTRLEYLFYQFDDQSTFCQTCIDPTYADGEIHFARAGVTYHMNGNTAAVDNDAGTDWSGLYLGGAVGALHSRLGTRDEDGTLVSTNVGQTAILENQAFAGTAFLGFNHQIGQAVMGVEADYTITNANDLQLYDAGGAADLLQQIELDGFGSVRGRLGLATGNALFYTTAGIGWVDAAIRTEDPGTPTQIVETDTFAAVVVGAGAAIQLTENWSARGEYLYYGFDEKSDTCLDCVEPAFFDGDLHTFRIGAAYRF